MGTNVVVNGYLYNSDGSGGTFRTTSSGLVADDGSSAPEDWTVPVSGHESIPGYSADENNPPLKTDLKGVYLWLANGGDLTGHILWLAHRKKKASVYSFIEHVGFEWIDSRNRPDL